PRSRALAARHRGGERRRPRDLPSRRRAAATAARGAVGVAAAERLMDISTFVVVVIAGDDAPAPDATLASVATQAGAFALRCHVQGASPSPAAWQVAEAWADRVDSGAFPSACQGLRLSCERGAG